MFIKITAVLALIGTGLGCSTLPRGRFELNSVTIKGNSAVDDDEIEAKIASQESDKLLWLFSGVLFDYQIFDRFVLERDLQRIERYYRSRGYFRAHVRAGRVFYSGRSTKVEILIEEGPPVLTRRIDVHGLDHLPGELAGEAEAAARRQLKLGLPFEEEAFLRAQDELLKVLADAGYAYATVERGADVDLLKNAASVGFWVEPRTIARFGGVRLEGLGPLPPEPVWRAIDLKEGDPFSSAELDEVQRALLDLGVFGSVTVEPDIPAQQEGPPPERVPILIRVEPSKLRSIHLGGGLQMDTQRTDVHLTAGWEDRNFLGGLRRFLVEGRPGVVVYPTRLPNFEAPERLLPEYRLRAEFREPGFLEARTNGLLRAETSMYPLLLSSARDPVAPIIGYRDLRLSAGLERSLWRLYGSVSYNFQVNNPFSYVGPLLPYLGTVFVSYPELFTTLDLRDDRVSPHAGLYVSNVLQIAGLGGTAQDLKLQPEARVYVPVTRRITLAARATAGLLFAGNYGDTVEPNSRDTLMKNEEMAADWVRDIQLMFLRGFFSGGAGSNRGYAQREIGPHGVVPFYNPGQSGQDQAQSFEELNARCRPEVSMMEPDAEADEARRAVCDLPLGGFTLWEAGLELRFPIAGALSGAVFSDASDVSGSRFDFRFNRPHLSAGLGFRYDTPVGPVRLDGGYRIPGLQVFGDDDTRDEGLPQELFGLPVSVSFGIGESF